MREAARHSAEKAFISLQWCFLFVDLCVPAVVVLAALELRPESRPLLLCGTRDACPGGGGLDQQHAAFISSPHVHVVYNWALDVLQGENFILMHCCHLSSCFPPLPLMCGSWANC